MLFTSYSFIAFITLLFITYYLIPKKYQWMLLLGASYLFYSFAGVKYLLYILLTTISTYVISLKIDKLYQIQSEYLSPQKVTTASTYEVSDQVSSIQKVQLDPVDANKAPLSREEKKAYKAYIKAKQWKWLLSCLLLNFGILAVLKYTNFALSNINSILTAIGSERQLSFWSLALPMGISFYTFQTMGYIIDVYRGKYSPERNIFKLALFTSFFPQLVQGPISRFDDLSKTLFEKHDYNHKSVSFGIQRILWGLFKKLVIADRLVVAVKTIIEQPETYHGVFVLVGMLFYAFQLYADFTGGIDITIGIAEVLGIKIKENFERPYFSKSITEYWRRWHITLGTWFKEYLFYPISVSKPMLNLSKFSRKHFGDAIGKRLPVYISTLIVWFTTGLWHGAHWNFIVWGLTNGVVILISQEFTPFYEWFHHKFPVKHTLIFRSFQVVRTILLMSAIRMFDCYRDVSTTFRMLGTMVTDFNASQLVNGSFMDLGLTVADYLVLLVALGVLVTVSLIQRSGSARGKLARQPQLVRYVVYYALIISILIFGAYGVGYDASQFIYNQF